MYAELHALSHYSFLRGASSPEELVAQAKRLGYRALALTDECSLAGVVRAHLAARAHALALIVGTELVCACGLKLVVLATSRRGYGQLSRLISRARRASPKGRYALDREDLPDALADCVILWLPPADAAAAHGRDPGAWLRERFDGRLWLGIELHTNGTDARRLAGLEALGAALGVPCVAAGDVHMHRRGRRALQDVLTAIRLNTPLARAGFALYPNGERHLRALRSLRERYPARLLAATLEIAERCRFDLAELRYEYPEELVPAGATPTSHLRALVERGAGRRWPDGVPAPVRAMLEHEISLIAELRYEPFFLTVHDVVEFARSRGILCQGRGSAANSAVCYCLGITEVDPARMSMLFERFISRERDEPPDIDVDFEHERREEVIQYLYAKYGRDRAALAATVISYRPKSALRDVGKALGFDLEQVDRLAKSMAWWDGRKVKPERLAEAGFDPGSPGVQLLMRLADELVGFPRHLSQHVGGFVIARGPLSHLVPIENAAMPERTVIQWDKDDLDAVGLLKVDVLALGMLSAIRRALDMLGALRGRPFAMVDIPREDPAVYAMIGRADTVGVFQIESRAQMSMLPRMQPRNFYDLVIEVAIVRPGPIQGGMVHPYLRRRQGLEAVSYPSAAVQAVLERTLGVPIFQEQVMQLAVVAAGFAPGEADQLRRSMAAWRRKGGLEHFERRLIEGMRARGYEEAFARQIFRQIQGFGEYGFPESHAASFALLVYVSAWLKRHEPAAFACALLNSQPMGFYAPSQIVQDARRHGVAVLPVDVNASTYRTVTEWVGRPGWAMAGAAGDEGSHDADPGEALPEGCGIGARPRPVRSPACLMPSAAARERWAAEGAAGWGIRLGLHLVSGIGEEHAARLDAELARGPYRTLADVVERTGLAEETVERLIRAGALDSLGRPRRELLWQLREVAGASRGRVGGKPVRGVAGGRAAGRPMGLRLPPSDAPALPPLGEAERLGDAYAIAGLDARRQAVSLFRDALEAIGAVTNASLAERRPGPVRIGGLVVTRQHPMTARGTVFLALEDETGMVNVTLWPDAWQRWRSIVRRHALLLVDGDLQREGEVVNVIARGVAGLVDATQATGGPADPGGVRQMGMAGMRRLG